MEKTQKNNLHALVCIARDCNNLSDNEPVCSGRSDTLDIYRTKGVLPFTKTKNDLITSSGTRESVKENSSHEGDNKGNSYSKGRVGKKK